MEPEAQHTGAMQDWRRPRRWELWIAFVLVFFTVSFQQYMIHKQKQTIVNKQDELADERGLVRQLRKTIDQQADTINDVSHRLFNKCGSTVEYPQTFPRRAMRLWFDVPDTWGEVLNQPNQPRLALDHPTDQ